MRVLNAYAGIGGNRHLWPSSWRVTAVEFDPLVAAEYQRRYPDDVVLVEDAHAHVLERSGEYDAVWSSPPCPTHSRLAKVVAARMGSELAPDPRLMAEVKHLRASGVPFVVENVHTYYRTEIAPDLVTARHYYWASDVPLLLTPLHGTAIVRSDTRASQFAAAYGLPPVPARALRDGRKAMRNAVVPIEGVEVATAAFASALVEVRAAG